VTVVERAELSPGYEISRVIRGGWQLAGGHGQVERKAAVEDLHEFFRAGIVTFDCADIYTGVEELLGHLRTAVLKSEGREALDSLKVHTKFVPDLDLLPRLKKPDVTAAVDRSLHRLGVERLDLVQYHWWDYGIPGCIEGALWLAELQRQGKIRFIGGTNFNTPQSAALLNAGVPLISMQVQYSLLDDRPEHGMAALCRDNGVRLLCYGSVAGGFLSDDWLGRPEPRFPLENRSLTKYKLIIDDCGGWDFLQHLLRVLRTVADRHGVDIATVASRAVLDRPQVSAVIVGARNSRHLAGNLAIMSLRLTPSDHAEIGEVLGRGLRLAGDVFDLERDRTGRHGAIMKYDLNRQAS
jgi:aryl-alcohol dehydrogenase-like predicted oxidoreductase